MARGSVKVLAGLALHIVHRMVEALDSSEDRSVAGMPELFRTGRICAVVAARSAAEMVRELRRALRLSRTVELRLDWLRGADHIERMTRWLAANRKSLGLGPRVTLIATCRRLTAGGQFRGNVARQLEVLTKVGTSICYGSDSAVLREKVRLESLREYSDVLSARSLSARGKKRRRRHSEERSDEGSLFLLDNHAREIPYKAIRPRLWLDLEIESAKSLSPTDMRLLRRVANVLVSFHDFRRTPANLGAVKTRLERAGGDAIKIAAHAKGLQDALRVLATARGGRHVVAVPMGETAAAARILALRAGSALAYAPVAAATAAGQISLEEMSSMYRAEQLTRRTRLYAVIGDPIIHSLSPRLHNAGFRARGMDAVYVPVLVRDLRDFLAAIGPLGIAGFSVTLPHKEAILRHLDDCDPLAATIGAVNTVVVRGGGKLYGYNTDYVGVLRALETFGMQSRKIPTRKSSLGGSQRSATRSATVAGSRVLVLGAGGSARAVAFASAWAGANVCVCARRMARARDLARAVGGEALERRRLRGEYFDAIVNATPVGMFPRVTESPLDAQELNCRLVFDLIYRPRETRLLQLARRRGVETISGLDMFVAQGTAQWEIWTGERAPVKEMMQAVEGSD